MELMESGPSYSEDYSSSSDYPDYSSDLSEDYDDEDEDMDIEYVGNSKYKYTKKFKAPKTPKVPTHGHYGHHHHVPRHYSPGTYGDKKYWKHGHYCYPHCDSEDSKDSADY